MIWDMKSNEVGASKHVKRATHTLTRRKITLSLATSKVNASTFEILRVRVVRSESKSKTFMLSARMLGIYRKLNMWDESDARCPGSNMIERS